MSNFFSEDNAFNRAMTRVFDLCVLNLLTVICCIPIFTAGAALTAMYSIMLKMANNEEGPIFKSYFKEFKSNFKSSIGGWLILIVIFAVLIFDLQLWTQVEVEYRSIFYGITLVILVAACAVTTWYFAIRAMFEETLKSGFVNASKFAIVYLPLSALFGIITVGVVYFFLHYPTLVIVMPVFGLALVEYPKALLIRKRFDKYIEQREGTSESDEESEMGSEELLDESEETEPIEAVAIKTEATVAEITKEETAEEEVTKEETAEEEVTKEKASKEEATKEETAEKEVTKEEATKAVEVTTKIVETATETEIKDTKTEGDEQKQEDKTPEKQKNQKKKKNKKR